MIGYDVASFARDIEDGLIEVSFPYIIVCVGSLNVKSYQVDVLHASMKRLVEAVNTVSENSLVIFSGVIPRPLEYQEMRKIDQNLDGSLKFSLAKDFTVV